MHRFVKKTYRGMILIEGARFPPFGFAITEISSSSNEYVSFCQKDLLCPDSDRGRSVSPLRVRHSGDKPRSLEVPRRESRSEINLCLVGKRLGSAAIPSVGARSVVLVW